MGEIISGYFWKEGLWGIGEKTEEGTISKVIAFYQTSKEAKDALAKFKAEGNSK